MGLVPTPIKMKKELDGQEGGLRNNNYGEVSEMQREIERYKGQVSEREGQIKVIKGENQELKRVNEELAEKNTYNINQRAEYDAYIEELKSENLAALARIE